jgi:hypothetical protein
MALITTPGDATANSFADVAYFRAFHVTRYPQIKWIATAVDAVVEALLIMAGRGLNNNLAWTGSAVDAVQAMTWPRVGMLTRNGFSIATSGADSIPNDLKNAQCELAGQMGAKDLVSDNDAALKGIASVKAGSVAVAFQNMDTSSPDAVDMMLRRMGSEFNYLSSEIPGEVRRLLVPSWFEQPTIVRKALFEVFGGCD